MRVSLPPPTPGGNPKRPQHSTLRRARADALHQQLVAMASRQSDPSAGVALVDVYRDLRNDGWTRSEIKSTVDELEAAARLRIESHDGLIWLHPLPPLPPRPPLTPCPPQPPGSVLAEVQPVTGAQPRR